MIKNVIFDVDGTLFDTAESIADAYEQTLKDYNFNIYNVRKKIVEGIGTTPQIFFKNLLPIDDDLAQKMTDHYRALYRDKFLGNAKMYPGIKELLNNLKVNSYSTYIVTNKRQDCIDGLIDIFNLKDLFLGIYGATPTTLKKVETLNKCIELNGLNKEETVLVGDSDNDKHAADASGIHFVGVNYGYGFKDQKDFLDRPSDMMLALSKYVM